MLLQSQSVVNTPIRLAFKLTPSQAQSLHTSLTAVYPQLATLRSARQVQMLNSGGRFEIRPINGGTLPAGLTAANVQRVIDGEEIEIAPDPDPDPILAEIEARPGMGEEMTDDEIEELFAPDLPEATDATLQTLIEKAITAWPLIVYRGGRNSRAHAAAALVEAGKVKLVSGDVWNVDGRLCNAEADRCDCEDHAHGAPEYRQVGRLCKHRLAARMARRWTGDRNEALLSFIRTATTDAASVRLIMEWDYDGNRRAVVGYESQVAGRVRRPGNEGVAFTWLQLRWALEQAGWGLARLPEKSKGFEYLMRLTPGRGIEVNAQTMNVKGITPAMVERRQTGQEWITALAVDGNRLGVGISEATARMASHRRAELAGAVQ